MGMAARGVWGGLVCLSLALVAADGVAYLWLIHRQHEGGPAWWFLAGLCLAFILGLVSLAMRAPGRLVAEAVGGVLLLAMGLLGIFSVGLPLLVAGVLLLIAAARAAAG